jgi:DNA replication and repair protein RecF
MPVRAISLSGFRSYEHLEMTLADGPHLVVGPNAAGKTNLVEALVVLSSGRSHRGSPDVEMVRWGSDVARVLARIERAGRSDEPEVVIQAHPVDGHARKRVRVNGVNRRPAALPAVMRTVVFAPEDMDLVAGAPALRRSFLDGLVAAREVTATAVLGTYARALTQRNALLRRIRDEVAGRAELSFWDDVLCETGSRIREWRAEAIAALGGPLAAAHREMAPAEPTLDVDYASNVEARAGESQEAALRRRLRETAEKEIWNGATLVGPHRDDLVLRADGRDLAHFASRGQQRTAILALKLAQLAMLTELDGQPPLLILDDVFSELDPERRARLVVRVGSLPQVIVTTTSADDLDQDLVAAATLWHVEPGSVSASPGP